MASTAACQAAPEVTPSNSSPQEVVLARLMALVRSGAILSRETYSEQGLKGYFGSKQAFMTFRSDETGAQLLEPGVFTAASVGAWAPPKGSGVGVSFSKTKEGHVYAEARISMTALGNGFLVELVQRQVDCNFVSSIVLPTDGALPRKVYECSIKAAGQIYDVRMVTYEDGSMMELSLSVHPRTS